MLVRRLGLVLLASLNLATARGGNPSLLDHGDAAVLSPPVADFRAEVQRISVSALLVPQTNSMETASAELQDLRAALEEAGRSAEAIEGVATNLESLRDQLEKFNRAWEASNDASSSETDENGSSLHQTARPSPAFPKIIIGDELPLEFIDYLQGVAAWRNPDFENKNVARDSWERILNRPPEERRFKSTWAAFMLGRSWEKQNPDKAIAFYEQVRALAKAGFADSAGLAYDSLGREARVFLDQRDFVRATELYLQVFATGDDSGYASLCFTMRALFRGDTSQFSALATNPQTRRVVTAYIVSTKALRICTEYFYNNDPDTTNRLVQVVNDWLAAADRAHVKDAETVEELALAAYQNGQWETAQRWIARSRPTPTIQWLQAKLLFRDGKSDQAGARLAALQRLFPLTASDTNAPAGLKDNLIVSTQDFDTGGVSAPDQIRGELGVYRLAREEYAGALDCFLAGDFWEDAAYVADRVMTTDELKSYVDTHWPAIAPAQRASDDGDSETTPDPLAERRQNIRHLLARRLTREIRGNEARDYFPDEWRPQFDVLVDSLTSGWDESLAPDQRAKALFSAACIARSNGLQLLATEVAPDWRICDGDSEWQLTSAFRTNETFTIFPASPDELRRDAQHKPDPDERFHYRYQAAFLAWEAAKLMPNNSDETARVLWTGGSWLKDRDPETADIFYKSLVRRCRKTELGAEADRKRWFPSLDDSGNFVSRPLRAEESTAVIADDDMDQAEEAHEEIVREYPLPGTSYVIHAGDSLSSIAAAASVLGQPITARNILEANPGLDIFRLRIGQKILIPAVNQNPTPE
jgi:tetratricopeptide (TPR) repeat protein